MSLVAMMTSGLGRRDRGVGEKLTTAGLPGTAFCSRGGRCVEGTLKTPAGIGAGRRCYHAVVFDDPIDGIHWERVWVRKFPRSASFGRSARSAPSPGAGRI
jgi:hypothetical protein